MAIRRGERPAVVTAPTGSPEEAVVQRVKKWAAWIVRQQRFFSTYLPKLPPRRYVGGVSHWYLGRQYRLRVHQADADGVKMARGQINVGLAAATVKGSVFYTDEFASYNGVKAHGKHVPIDHQETFGIGRAHINGIEGFWSFAKRLYRHVHGVDPGNFPLYLAEYEFRYNHRGEHLMTLLYDCLIRASVPTRTMP